VENDVSAETTGGIAEIINSLDARTKVLRQARLERSWMRLRQAFRISSISGPSFIAIGIALRPLLGAGSASLTLSPSFIGAGLALLAMSPLLAQMTRLLREEIDLLHKSLDEVRSTTGSS
jgi:hypothetical protein